VDKDKLLRKVQGLNPTKRSTESLSAEDKKRYKREVGRSPDDRLYYVSPEQEKQKNEVNLKGAKRNLITSQVELDGAQRIIGSKKDGKTLPNKVKEKVNGVRRTLKPSR
jgi:hypothetical protein